MTINWKQIVYERLAVLRLPPERELEIVEEVALHLEAIYDDARAEGLLETEAQTHAVRSYDWQLLECELSRTEQSQLTRALQPSLELIEHKGGVQMESVFQDLRYGVRMLTKNAGFTLMAVLMLGLGIGANTAIFSIVNAALLRRLPYDATRMVAVNSFNPQKDQSPVGASAADFLDWQAQCQTCEQLTIYSGGGIRLKETERMENISGARVAVNFFATFGVQPLLGRAFTNEEGVTSGPPVVILSHRLWQQRFGGDPQIIGRTLATGDDGRPALTVVGVMPPDFKFPSYAQVWTPLQRDIGEMKARSARYFQVIGRIKPGQTIASVQSEMSAIAARLAEAYPKDNQGKTVLVTDWRDSLVQDSRKALMILMGAVLFVLLIACANVANLLLTRAATRRKEMAIRLALGASRRTLLRQLLLESLLLAGLGGALGLMLANWGITALTQLLPELNFSFQSLSELRDEIRIDRGVLLFTLAISLLTGLLFGLVPGWQAAKTDVNDALKEGGRGNSSAGQQRTRHVLVVAEMALALVLLVGAGLLINSFARMLNVEVGYDPQGVMTLPLSLPAQNKYAFAEQVMERIAATPGVASVALMSYPQLGGLSFGFNRENKPLPNGDTNVAYSAISPAYLRTLKAVLRSGREFNDRDLPNAPPVALINETMARQYFGGENPVGQKLVINYMGQHNTREIVGVVGDIKQEEPKKPTKPEILVPFAQLPWFGSFLLVRSVNPDPLTIKNAVQQAIWSVNPTLPEAKAEPLTNMLAGQVAEPRLYALLLGLFAAIALLLAAAGIYSVLAYSVTQRTHEIGIRLALGAQVGDVLRLVVKEGMKLALIGVGLGLVAAFVLMRLMKGLLFGVSATDPLTFGAIAGLLTLVALVASYFPARRATKVDPLIALRSE